MKVDSTTFRGQEVLSVSTRLMDAMVQVNAGPRIISLKRVGDNGDLMFQDPALYGPGPGTDDAKPIGRGSWNIMAGARVWTYRDTHGDETEESYASDNRPCTVEESGDSLIITGAICPSFLIQRGLIIKENVHGGLDVTSFVKNTSDLMLWSGGVWAIAVLNPNCKIGILTGDPNSNWQATAYHVVWNWAGHCTTQAYVNNQLRLEPGLLLALPGNEEGKVMAYSPIGAIIAQTADTAFFKLVKANPNGAYPSGCNTAIYSAPNRLFRESETMGPFCPRLEAGQTLCHTERWILGPPIPWAQERANGLHYIASEFLKD